MALFFQDRSPRKWGVRTSSGYLLFFLILLLLGPPRTAPASDLLSSKDLLGRVSQEFQRHNYKGVIRLYKEFSAAQPGEFIPIRIRVLYSESLADTGEIDEAIHRLQDLLNEYPTELDNLSLQYNLANLLFMEKRYKEARDAYQKILFQASRHNEIISKTRERIGLMKESENRKKDNLSLQLMDVETSLETNEVPEGAQIFLNKIAEQTTPTPYTERAKQLLQKIKEIRTVKAKALLDEARRLFDEERKYAAVRQILEDLQRDYSDVSEEPSVAALLKAVNAREGKAVGR